MITMNDEIQSLLQRSVHCAMEEGLQKMSDLLPHWVWNAFSQA